MFATIEQGLTLYKDTLKNFLQRCKEISEANKKVYGADYHGLLDWSKQDYEWVKRKEAEMVGMEDALGLSKDEVSAIVSETKKEIGMISGEEPHNSN